MRKSVAPRLLALAILWVAGCVLTAAASVAVWELEGFVQGPVALLLDRSSFAALSTSGVFLAFLLIGLVQAALLVRAGLARPWAPALTAAAALLGWLVQVEGLLGWHVFAYLGGNAIGSATLAEYLALVTAGFALTGLGTAAGLLARPYLAAAWALLNAAGGLAYAWSLARYRFANNPVHDFRLAPFVPALAGGLALGVVTLAWLLWLPELDRLRERLVRMPAVGLAVSLALLAALAGGAYLAWNAAFGPIDDPAYYCGSPDPPPPPSLTATRILRECDAGAAVRLSPGETVAVDLLIQQGVDTSFSWTGPTVSDGSVLVRLSGPAPLERDRSGNRIHLVALYRVARPGTATLEAVGRFCTANGGGSCGRGHLWRVTVSA